jgi:hypothetical protein
MQWEEEKQQQLKKKKEEEAKAEEEDFCCCRVFTLFWSISLEVKLKCMCGFFFLGAKS